MGQKIHPIGFRLGISRGWDSTWFGSKFSYSVFVKDDYKIRKEIMKLNQDAGITKIEIERIQELHLTLNEDIDKIMGWYLSGAKMSTLSSQNVTFPHKLLAKQHYWTIFTCVFSTKPHQIAKMLETIWITNDIMTCT